MSENPVDELLKLLPEKYVDKEQVDRLRNYCNELVPEDSWVQTETRIYPKRFLKQMIDGTLNKS